MFICFIPFSRAPDALINSEADLFAVKNDDGTLLFSSGRGDSYAAETWLRRNAQATDIKRAVWPKEGTQGYLVCDSFACRFEKDGQRISFLRNIRALAEECLWAHLVVSEMPIEKAVCQTPFIDRFSVWRNGVHSLYVDQRGIMIDTVEKERGLRPWTQTAANKKRE